jgi:hypothetical protein
LILLMTLLPLQFSWAVVATYCGHEEQAGGAHFGHHAHHGHEHHGQEDGATDAAAPMTEAQAATPGEPSRTVGDLNADCGHCHGMAATLSSVPSAWPGVPAASPPRAGADEAGGAHPPARPERPQWPDLA